MSSYTYHDVAGCLVAVLGFALVLLGPGYLLGWVTNLLGFRQRSLGERVVWSVPLSFGLTTVIAVMVSKYGSLGLACWVLGAMGIVATGMIAFEMLRGARLRPTRAGVVLGVLFTIFVVGELVDIGFGNKLYMSTTIFDHSVRASFVDAVVRTGVPPHNPLYWTVSETGGGHAAAMRYYYFWYVVCGVVVKIAGVSARQAMIASCVWSGFGLVAVIALYCAHFLKAAKDAEVARRRLWISVGLLAVTGLDIIPVLVGYFRGQPIDPDMEWWGLGQVTSWMDTILWVPHHLAGLVCCVFGFLLVWMAGPKSWPQRLLCGLFAGIGFAASFGLSTYVSIAFAVVMAMWLLWSMGWKEGRSRCPALGMSAVVAVVLLVPFLRELRAAGPTADGKTSPLAFSARRMIEPDAVAGLPGFKQMRRWSAPAEDEIAVLLLMVPGYAVELGFFAVVLVLVLVRRRELDLDPERTAMFLSLNGLLVSSFIRSTVIGTNDFGIRSALVPQFFLLLLAARLLDGTMKTARRSVQWALGIALVLGVVGTVYQASVLRLYLPVQDKLQRQNLAGLTEKNMALREVLHDLDVNSPRMAVVQYDTHQPNQFFNYSQLVNTPRQLANGFPDCDVAFGGDIRPCEGIKVELARLYLEPEGYRDGSKAEDADGARKSCLKLGVNELVATQWDPIWKAKDSWVWGLPVVAGTSRVRVVNCGN